MNSDQERIKLHHLVIPTKYCFLILGEDTRFIFFIYFSFLFYAFMPIFVIYKVFLLPYFNVIIIIFLQFLKFFHVPGCSGMFWNVPACSMFRVLSTPVCESYQLRPETLEGLFNPHPARWKNKTMSSEIGFPTLTSGAFLNQEFNKQTSRE